VPLPIGERIAARRALDYRRSGNNGAIFSTAIVDDVSRRHPDNEESAAKLAMSKEQ